MGIVLIITAVKYGVVVDQEAEWCTCEDNMGGGKE